MLSIIHSAALLGIDAYAVNVEVDLSSGLPAFDIVGLPDSAVKESRERVRTAIKNTGLSFPTKRITVNLAPADTKKEGASFDLPIAAGILTAMGTLPAEALDGYLLAGELSLDGSTAFCLWSMAHCRMASQNALCPMKMPKKRLLWKAWRSIPFIVCGN